MSHCITFVCLMSSWAPTLHIFSCHYCRKMKYLFALWLLFWQSQFLFNISLKLLRTAFYSSFTTFDSIFFFFSLQIPEKKLSMRWRMKTWPDEHYSVVTIELEEAEDCTRLTLKQTGIPAGEVDRTKEGWQLNFWQRIKQAFGFEARLYWQSRYWKKWYKYS